MQEQEEQEFWEWCGFKQLEAGRGGYHFRATKKVWNWLPPNETERHKSIPFLPRLDLNNLFRYAVPKLLEEKKNPALSITFTWDDAEDKCMCDISPYNWGEDKDPAQALYQAIQGVRKLC